MWPERIFSLRCYGEPGEDPLHAMHKEVQDLVAVIIQDFLSLACFPFSCRAVIDERPSGDDGLDVTWLVGLKGLVLWELATEPVVRPGDEAVKRDEAEEKVQTAVSC